MIEDYRDLEPIPENGNDFIADASTRLFECIYYNHTGRVKQRCEIKARNIEEATTHFKFFYPKKLLWKITAL